MMAIKQLQNIALPPLCLRCDAMVSDVPGLCAVCWPSLHWLAAPLCPHCGAELPHAGIAGAEWSCAACLIDPPEFSRARAALAYDDHSAALVADFKYHDRLEGAPLFAAWMHRAGADLLDGIDAIVPVPLHPLRLWRRQYNQAALLAQNLSTRIQRPYAPHWLCRVRHTLQQAKLGKEERQQNVRDAFKVPVPAQILGKTILLVDDVFTTGATLREATRTLLRAGAKEVRVMTLTRR